MAVATSGFAISFLGAVATGDQRLWTPKKLTGTADGTRQNMQDSAASLSQQFR